jgi:hypothetical protein
MTLIEVASIQDAAVVPSLKKYSGRINKEKVENPNKTIKPVNRSKKILAATWAELFR